MTKRIPAQCFHPGEFISDEAAIRHAKFETERRGKPVKVARWLDTSQAIRPNEDKDNRHE